MRTIRWIILAVFLCAAVAGAESFKTYEGAWFDIRYPASFTVKPQQQCASGEGYDAVSFLSPDGLVEFYVYSPQWSGEPQWIHRRPGEQQASYSRQTVRSRTITYVTRKGPGYLRSYADTRDAMCNTRWVLGYQYQNQAAYNKYRPLYLKFKQSLRQYAD
jgi:hypothetical protein